MWNDRNASTILMGAILLCHINSLKADPDEGWPLNKGRVECGQVANIQKSPQDVGNFYRSGPGRKGSGSGRILYGNDAKPGEWPWIVQLVTVIQGEVPNNCSGSLINSRWVLTAGHCVERVSEPKYWKATFGLYNVDEPDYMATDRLIDEIILHPNYKDLNNDIALYRLSEPIEFNTYIRPVCLIDTNQDVVAYTRDKNCFTMGYGYKIGMRPANKLQNLRVIAQPNAYCLPNWAGKMSRVKVGAVCVGPNNPETIGATCRGDSGGPNVCFNEQTSQWEQFGIVSYGPSRCNRDQGDKWLTAVTDLTHYGDWIRANARIDHDSQ